MNAVSIRFMFPELFCFRKRTLLQMRWDITYMMETKGDIIQVSLTKLLKSTFGSMALQTTNQNTPKREYQ